jgi:hypothetical protein
VKHEPRRRPRRALCRAIGETTVDQPWLVNDNGAHGRSLFVGSQFRSWALGLWHCRFRVVGAATELCRGVTSVSK